MLGIFAVRRRAIARQVRSVHESQYKRHTTIRRARGLLVLAGLVVSSALLPLSHALPGDYKWANTNLDGDQTAWQTVASSADGTKLIAATQDGSLYTSTNSGATWVERTSAGIDSWSSVASSADGTKLVATTNTFSVGGYLYTSTDSGVTWTKRTSAGFHYWQSVVSSADGTKLVAITGGYYAAGYLYTSTDSGVTWTEQTALDTHNWRSIAASSDCTKLIATTFTMSDVDGVYVSTDSGATWEQHLVADALNGAAWASVASSADGTKLAIVAPGGPLYTSTDSGVTWTERTSVGSRYWQSITSSADGTKLAVVEYGGPLYTSTDSGVTWTERTSVGSRHWQSITSSASGTKLVLTDYGGSVYTSADSGATWSEMTVAGSRAWQYIAASADGTKLAAIVQGGLPDYESIIYTSVDSGSTWTKHALGFVGLQGIVSSADGTKLAVIEGEGCIYTSADSGATWTKRESTGTQEWASIAMSSDGTKLASATYSYDYESGHTTGAIYTSSDSGATWTEQTSIGLHGGWQSLASSADGTKLAAVANNGTNDNYLYTSMDSGVTWTEHSSISSAWWQSVTSSADGTKLVAISRDYDEGISSEVYRIYYSQDSGSTWVMQKQLRAIPGGPASVSSSADGTKLVATFSHMNIYTSSNSGTTWVEQQSTGSRNWWGVASSASGTKLAAIVNGGGIYLATTEGPATATYNYISTAAPADATPAITQSSLSTTSSTCYVIASGSTAVLGSANLTVPQQNVTLLGGIAYNMSCATQGGSTEATITLGTYYPDVSKLRIYKKSNSSSTLVDITSDVTITNTTDSSNNPITTVRYTLVDGGDYDEDGAVNGVIVDPLYVGVVQTPGAPGTLAATGSDIWAVGLEGIGVILAGAWLLMKRRA